MGVIGPCSILGLYGDNGNENGNYYRVLTECYLTAQTCLRSCQTEMALLKEPKSSLEMLHGLRKPSIEHGLLASQRTKKMRGRELALHAIMPYGLESEAQHASPLDRNPGMKANRASHLTSLLSAYCTSNPQRVQLRQPPVLGQISSTPCPARKKAACTATLSLAATSLVIIECE